jgi:hypothetical protein
MIKCDFTGRRDIAQSAESGFYARSAAMRLVIAALISASLLPISIRKPA